MTDSNDNRSEISLPARDYPRELSTLVFKVVSSSTRYRLTHRIAPALKKIEIEMGISHFSADP